MLRAKHTLSISKHVTAQVFRYIVCDVIEHKLVTPRCLSDLGFDVLFSTTLHYFIFLLVHTSSPCLLMLYPLFACLLFDMIGWVFTIA